MIVVQSHQVYSNNTSQKNLDIATAGTGKNYKLEDFMPTIWIWSSLINANDKTCSRFSPLLPFTDMSNGIGQLCSSNLKL